ncbi:zinc ABC transporter permease [Aerococcus urinaehominis]|uniref:Zinc ABC transporter permease n=1 Tax=Aerococcus urinaehominis TaxID=128944 RepID=A0A0X8FJU6_9LACT|nr:metal ABC transporter permease [Aerococcus urinaehominis]AMB98642.1 zinc ABC transporter permease [Aerococcus urinaehominis]SDL96590.1 manganese/zinc/iron transport system permease protein [Aerococcus urinaehominis]
MANILQLLHDYTFQVVAIGTGMLGILSGIIGSLAVLRKESLLGDALSHAALPGIVVGFMLVGHKNLMLMLLGATVSGLLATILIRWISKGSIKMDASLSLILSSFFALGLVLLTQAQKTPNAQQAGLKNFIYGQASAMLKGDVITIVVTGLIFIALIILFWKELKAQTFDPVFFSTLAFSPKLVQFVFSLILVVTVILGLESVGVILMSALLISPPVAARQWTNRLETMVILSGCFGLAAGLIGTLWSSMTRNMPTGPAIVLVASIIVLFSILFAPNRGLLARSWQYHQRKKHYQKIMRERGQD